MKKFFFSLIFIGLWTGSLFYLGQNPEAFPEAIRAPMERCAASVQNIMGGFEKTCATYGLQCDEPWSANKNLVIMGVLSFFALWIGLSFLLGIRGFFRDLFFFFPLRK